MGSRIVARYRTSSGEVWDAATTEPADGMCVLPALPREPLRTPSTCKSTHQMPGIPIIHHKFALRRRVPGVVHWTRANQVKPKKIRKGIRRKKRNTRHGKSHGVLPPAFETGKKGAMPEPLSRYCPYFSIVTAHTPAKPRSIAKRSLHNRRLNLSQAQRQDTRRRQ